jgi:type VI secretion system secreted protein Hcp
MPVDMFLKLGTIDGESTREGFKDWIEIESFSWGEAQSPDEKPGRPTLQDFHFATRMSKASPKLMEACATGTFMKESMLVGLRSGQERTAEFMTFKLTDVLISSYQTSGAAASDLIPTDSFSLNFAKLEFTYTPQRADGSAGTPVTGRAEKRK